MRIGVRSVVAAVIQLSLESLSCHCSWIMEKILIRHQGNGSLRCDDKEYLSWFLSSKERKMLEDSGPLMIGEQVTIKTNHVPIENPPLKVELHNLLLAVH